MALDMALYRPIIANLFFGDTWQIRRNRSVSSGAATEPHPDGPLLAGPFRGKLSLRDQASPERTSDGQIQERGSYRLKCDAVPTAPDGTVPLDADGQPWQVLATDQILIDDRVFEVKWTPLVSATALKRVIGLEEATP